MKKPSRLPWLIFLALLVIGLGSGYYFYSHRQPPHQHRAAIQTAVEDEHPASGAQLEEPSTPQEPAKIDESEAETPEPPETEEPSNNATAQPDPCEVLFSRLQNYFEYLDGTEYFQRLSPDVSAYERLKVILKKLIKHPPVPAEEASDPRILLANLHHFFRTLKAQDLRLASEILTNEPDSMEDTFDMLFSWLMLPAPCADPDSIRPSFQVTYTYAAFFVNTVGGRAYLFRRTPSVRVVVQYYALMVIYEADKRKNNTYGVDLLPLLTPLRNEISRFDDLIFQQQYLTNLDRIEYEYRRLR